MGLKEKLEKMAKKAVVIGSVAAATAFAPQAKASQPTETDVTNGPKDLPEFVVSGVSEQQEAAQPDKVEAHTFLEQIKKGKKIEYNGITFDIPKLNASKDKDLKNFGFVFEDGMVGIKIHDDGKRTWSRNKPEKTYKVLMPEQDFENIMNILMGKDQGRVTSDRPENPYDWEWRDNFPHFYTVDKDGTQRNMTEAEAGEFYSRAIDTFCAANGILDVSAMLRKYKKAIESADYGWILAKAMDASTSIQNALISKAANKYKGSFVNLAVNTDAIRKANKEEFEISKRVAIRRYERDKQEQAEIEQIRAERLAREQLAEQNRRAQLLTIESVENPHIEVDSSVGSYLSFNCNGARFDIQTNNQKITNSTVSLNGEFRSLGIQPEEWKQISIALNKNLSVQQKDQLGANFFDLIQQQTSPTVASAKPTKKTSGATTIIITNGGAEL